jgi:hypothetical protein
MEPALARLLKAEAGLLTSLSIFISLLLSACGRSSVIMVVFLMNWFREAFEVDAILESVDLELLADIRLGTELIDEDGVTTHWF